MESKKYFCKYLPVEVKTRKEMKNHRVLTKDGRLGTVVNTGIDTGIYGVNFDDGTSDYDDFIEWKPVKLFLCSRDNPDYRQEILTKDIKEGQEFSEKEKKYLTLGSVVEK